MSVRYADTSALVRCYLVDEADHERLRALLLEGREPVVTSELTRVELASALSTAARSGRLRRPDWLLARADADCGPDGPIALLALDPGTVLPRARQLVLDHPVRTLDAIHLAVAATTATELAAGEPLEFVTCDQRQAQTADVLGLALA
ncbi:MAG: type II toxin-antitoxin system VapC family toxin [Pseudonocardiaceae bacterium]